MRTVERRLELREVSICRNKGAGSGRQREGVLQGLVGEPGVEML